MLKQINKSTIYYNDMSASCVNDYYMYIISIIAQILTNHDIQCDVLLDCEVDGQKLHNKIIHIGINYEHTLVKYGGRTTNGACFGKIKVDCCDEYYLVRIDKYDELNKKDIVIDYSNMNIINVKESQMYDKFGEKMIYVSPLLYDVCFDKNNKNIELLTTFININEPRRYKLINELQKNNIKHININNCFDKASIISLYKNTKVMINIHQTYEHHTLEELRVLPALMNGIIVICENSPLKNSVPYSEFVLWSSYEDIIETYIFVQNNYDELYNKIFENGKLSEIFNDIAINNYKSMEYAITNLCGV